ncbi:ribosomal RNA-processing protein 8 [Ceratitis capitata]|uniref:Ribosomal RNA-processing protein 8 n=1 Tax=Ceratitis capitata TaxID=7213 RepID=W8BIY2_CERCA|nr:ribosomal RNA-processing protein 8 [Ceratitis capitata]CAD7013073.1 unnamed protein product [Ceratitis capitata]
MSKFFVPSSWEDLAEAVRFRSKISLISAGTNANAERVIKTAVKNKKSKKLKSDTEVSKNFSKTQNSKSVIDSKKIKNGRVIKRNSAKKPNLQNKALVSSAEALPPMAANLASNAQLTIDEKGKQKKSKFLTVGSEKILKSIATKNPSYSTASKHNVRTESVETSSDDVGLKVFENSLKKQLLGGRFRYINEQLYSMHSTEADAFFKSDAEAFNAYHTGYQQQVEKWPINPLDRIVKMIKRLPKSLEIVDFGCGEGRLAMSLPNKVYSMDLVSTRNDIIACDMSQTPLSDHSVDIAVYCLSLMGTNLKDYLLEANRVLRHNGFVLIAEIQSRFDDIREFIRGLEACGFQLLKKDDNEKLFYFFQFKKVRNVGKVALIPPFSLKPCLYRKR